MKKLKIKFGASVLTKLQMKTIKGGLQHCSTTDYAQCSTGCYENPQYPYDPQDTVNGICRFYDDTYISIHCYLDSDCLVADPG